MKKTEGMLRRSDTTFDNISFNMLTFYKLGVQKQLHINNAFLSATFTHILSIEIHFISVFKSPRFRFLGKHSQIRFYAF